MQHLPIKQNNDISWIPINNNFLDNKNVINNVNLNFDKQFASFNNKNYKNHRPMEHYKLLNFKSNNKNSFNAYENDDFL